MTEEFFPFEKKNISRATGKYALCPNCQNPMLSYQVPKKVSKLKGNKGVLNVVMHGLICENCGYIAFNRHVVNEIISIAVPKKPE